MMDVDFEVRCEGANGGLYGQLRLRSTRSGVSIGSVDMSALSPVAPGTPLRFSVAMDASLPLEFKFIRYRWSTGRWEIVQDYSFRAVWSWMPTVGDLDDYYLQVWVRARGSANAYDEWRLLWSVLDQSHNASGFTAADVALPASAGNTDHVDGGGSRRCSPVGVSVRPLFFGCGPVAVSFATGARSPRGSR